MNDIPIENKRQLLAQNLMRWRNTAYDAETDAKVGDIIGDEQIKQQAATRLKNALKAIDAIEQIISDLEKDDD